MTNTGIGIGDRVTWTKDLSSLSKEDCWTLGMLQGGLGTGPFTVTDSIMIQVSMFDDYDTPHVRFDPLPKGKWLHPKFLIKV